MTTSALRKQISDRLFNEGICTLPQDDRSLDLIIEYMMARQTGSDLMRRLSTVELNYAQISGETQDMCHRADLAKNSIASILRQLTDEWRMRGILRDFVFSFSDNECEYIRSGFISVLESIRFQLRMISDALILLGETAAQIRACSACFTEIYRETKLAVYAAMLNKSLENILDCRAIALLAHASASECDRASGIYLGNARTCARIITEINQMMNEVMFSLRINADTETKVNIISPVKAANSISDMILRLEKINLEIKE